MPWYEYQLFLGCKVWVVNYKLYIFFSMVGSCYIIAKGDSSMLATFGSNQWCISDEYQTFSNQSYHNIFLLVIVYGLSSDGFFFPTWDLHVWMNFINFMPFIILIILIFSNLAALAFDQWCICDDFGTSTNQFGCDHCFVGFFKGFVKDFSLST